MGSVATRMWETVELRELRVFLTLAKELHFGRAAERLGLTSSRVSQSLRELETKLGGRLVHRTSRRVALTPFGERFFVEANAAYVRLLDVFERAHAANRGIEGVLRLGEYFSAGGPHLVEIIEEFETRHPGCQVVVSEVAALDPLRSLRAGEVDLIAVRFPISQPDLEVGPVLSSEPRILAVAPKHPLAARRSVTFEDLADYPIGDFSEALPAELIADFWPSQTASGRTIPRMKLKVRTPSELAAQVALGRIVHPTVPTWVKRFSEQPGLTAIPFSDLGPSRSGLVWRRGHTHPRLRAFLQTTADVLGRLRLDDETIRIPLRATTDASAQA